MNAAADYQAALLLVGRQSPREPVLHVPEDCSTQVDIVLHEAHACIPWPALLVVVTHNVLIVGVWVLSQVPLDEVLRFLSSKPEHDVHLQRGCMVHNKDQASKLGHRSHTIQYVTGSIGWHGLYQAGRIDLQPQMHTRQVWLSESASLEDRRS